jgi:membrane protein CcdC involved in cytochrome C biogenesis
MSLKILGYLRIGLMIIIGLLAIGGLFPGLLLEIVGEDTVDAGVDVFLLMGLFYFMTFLLIMVWLILVALERRLQADDSKKLEDSENAGET